MVTAHNRARRARIAYWITLALVALAVGTLLLLRPLAGSGRGWTIHWLPGSGPMELGLGETGFWAALVTAGACLLALAAARAERSPASGALVVLALLGGAGAFLAEHFLLRYVALEIVALAVALGPLAEGGDAGAKVAGQADRGRWVRLVYLVLRVGDAGLLAGILALWSGTGTLEIAPALEAGAALPAGTLNWIAAGLLLAVWVKLGGWPLHVWQQAGTRLSLFSQTWLYRTLMPNLGLYLLYRVTPLLAQAGPLRTSALWIGALGAAWAALLALGALFKDAEDEPCDRLDAAAVYLWAAQGGLALVLAAAGLKSAVWLMVLALTPLRLLLALAGETAQTAARPAGRKAAALGFGLGALSLLALDLLVSWWARQAGLALSIRLVVGAAIGLIGAWGVVLSVDLWRGALPASQNTPGAAVRRWASVAALACGAIAAWCLAPSLLNRLAQLSHGDPFVLPGPAAALRALASNPTGLIACVLALRVVRLARQGVLLSGVARSGQGVDPALAMERGIRRFARAVHTIVEAGVSARALAGVTQGTLGAARLAHRWIEGVVLEGATRQIAQTATEGGRLAYGVLEQGGLEGLLRRSVRAVLAGSRWLQRRHTGRLRLNLAWVAASLALAALALILFVW